MTSTTCNGAHSGPCEAKACSRCGWENCRYAGGFLPYTKPRVVFNHLPVFDFCHPCVLAADELWRGFMSHVTSVKDSREQT